MAKRPRPQARRRSPAKIVAIGLAILLPLAALCLYLVYGSPRLPDQPLVARLQDPATEQNLPALIARVEARLRARPDEGEGWEVIAPVYMSIRRYADAAEAYRQATRLLGETPKRLAGFGQALVLASDGIVSEEARLALQRAAELDPNLIEAKILLIIAKEQDGKFADAVEGWKALLASAPPDAPWREVVQQRLKLDETHLAGGPAPPPALGAGGDTSPQGKSGPNAGDVAAAQNMSPAGRQAMIETMVQRLSDRLAQQGDDLAGWLKLVRAYTVLDRKDDAVKALERAKTQFTGNAQALRTARHARGRAWLEVVRRRRHEEFWMTRKQRRVVLIGTCLAVLALAVGLVLVALRDSIVFFYSPSEVSEKQLGPGQRFRLGGLVEDGSLKRDEGTTVRFVVTDKKRHAAGDLYRRAAGPLPRRPGRRGRRDAGDRRRIPCRQRARQARRELHAAGSRQEAERAGPVARGRAGRRAARRRQGELGEHAEHDR